MQVSIIQNSLWLRDVSITLIKIISNYDYTTTTRIGGIALDYRAC